MAGPCCLMAIDHTEEAQTLFTSILCGAFGLKGIEYNITASLRTRSRLRGHLHNGQFSIIPCIPRGRFTALFTMPRTLFGWHAPVWRDDYPLRRESLQNCSDRAFARFAYLLIQVTESPVRFRRDSETTGACLRGLSLVRARSPGFPPSMESLPTKYPPKTTSFENH